MLALASGALAAGGLAAPPASAAGPELGECAAGKLCLWPRAGFRGERHAYERSRVSFGSCIRLPGGAGAESFANRTGRPVTVYESAECAETAEFHTHPSGSWTPDGAYKVRAFKVWER
ncbi:peptidase inhibitor family I36 protein [Streptomyces sp. HNM0575]|uniref:peptidase inhibitor family I36 protein n=1 Tax=Streptomyces sp. HNM0575 TaxID=2716338 RepID=UPI0032165C95